MRIKINYITLTILMNFSKQLKEIKMAHRLAWVRNYSRNMSLEKYILKWILSQRILTVSA